MSIFQRPAIVRFLKYVLVGGSATLFDLASVWVMTEHIGLPFYVSIAAGFLIGSTPNYFLARAYVFTGTKRRLKRGYLYYIIAALFGALIVTVSTTFLVMIFAMHYLHARILVAGATGMANYLFNLYFNFRVAGHHL